MNIDHELAGENGTSRGLGSVVENDRRGLDAHVHGRHTLGLDPGALLVVIMMVLVVLVAVEDVHDERFLRPSFFFCRGLVGIDWREEGLRVRFNWLRLGQRGRRHPDEGAQQTAWHLRLGGSGVGLKENGDVSGCVERESARYGRGPMGVQNGIRGDEVCSGAKLCVWRRAQELILWELRWWMSS